MDLHLLTLSELALAYRARMLAPTDVVEAYLTRIERLDPGLGAYVHVDAAEARREARARTEELHAGRTRGPVHGLPVALKDLIDIDGTVTMAGSAANLGRRSEVTATVAAKLMDAGMIVLGKLHTVEFAFGGWGTNPHFGTPRNPWDRERHRVPGGSSSGAGVAVAAGLAPCAIGTDTGGSVRLPASFCGVTGLKTTKGLVSRHGIIPLSPSLDTVGPITRSADDAALLLGAMEGEDPLDPSTLRQPRNSHHPSRDLSNPVLGRLARADYQGVHPDVWANYEAALQTFEERGARLRTIMLPRNLVDYVALSILLEAEAYALHGAIAEDASSPIGPAVRARLLKGNCPARDYLQARWQVPSLQDSFLAALDGVDALLTPTTTTTAIPVDEVDEATTPAMLTRFVNLLGLCALALPSGFDGSGLPTSLQIVGRPFDECGVIAVGRLYQQHTAWHRARPPQM